jgi:hypothetical protein
MNYDYAMSQPVGFQKLAFAPRLTGMALGAAAGGLAAPEDEGWTGAALGGLAGYGLGALGDRAYKAVRGHAGPAATPSAAAAEPLAAAPGPTTPNAVPAGTANARVPFRERIGPHVEALKDRLSKAKVTAQDVRARLGEQGAKLKERLSQMAGDAQKAVYDRAAIPSLLETAGQNKDLSNALARTTVDAQLRGQPRSFQNKVRRSSGYTQLTRKQAEYGLSAGIPGLGVSHSVKDERLEGMNRWVPRQTLEQAYQGLEQGLDQQALLEQAAESGHIAHPALGAGLAAALAHVGLPASHAGLKALAGFAGGGAGALYNRATAPNRVEDMRQAIRGVRGEMNKQPTAREATPLVMSSSAGET